jgi:tetratricopeptide (TPR) repeat protein
VREAEATFRQVEANGFFPRLAALGRIHVALAGRRADEAERLAETWLAAHPDQPDLALSTARLLLDREFAGNALSVARRLVARRPDLHDALAIQVDALRALGRPGDAVAAARAYVDVAPDRLRPSARLFAAQCRLKLTGDGAQEALRLAREASGALALPTERAHAWALEAEALLALPRTAEARVTAAARLTTWPPAGADRIQLRPMEQRLLFVHGTALLVERKPGEAAEVLSRCYDLDPDDLATLNNLAHAMTSVEGSESRAHELSRRATELAPDHAGCWATRGRAAQAAEDARDAEASWRKALDLFAVASPPRPAARARSALGLAGLLRAQDRDEEARALARGILDYAAGTNEEQAARAFLSRP